jgi:hypothetical protein
MIYSKIVKLLNVCLRTSIILMLSACGDKIPAQAQHDWSAEPCEHFGDFTWCDAGTFPVPFRGADAGEPLTRPGDAGTIYPDGGAGGRVFPSSVNLEYVDEKRRPRMAWMSVDGGSIRKLVEIPKLDPQEVYEIRDAWVCQMDPVTWMRDVIDDGGGIRFDEEVVGIERRCGQDKQCKVHGKWKECP